MNTVERAKTPWHLWVVGALALLWNSGGAYDYTMTQTRNMDYLTAGAEAWNLDPGVLIAYYTAFPAWADAAWARGVWGAIAGSLLLLLRSRFAFHAFLISIIGLAGTTAYTMTSDIPPELQSTSAWLFSAAIVIITVLLTYYAKRQTAAGILR